MSFFYHGIDSVTRPEIRPIKCGFCHKAKGDSVFTNSAITYIMVGGTFTQQESYFSHAPSSYALNKQADSTVRKPEENKCNILQSGNAFAM